MDRAGPSVMLVPMEMPAILIGKIHSQHTSDMGFMKLPPHFAEAVTGNIRRQRRNKKILFFGFSDINFSNLHFIAFLPDHRWYCLKLKPINNGRHGKIDMTVKPVPGF